MQRGRIWYLKREIHKYRKAEVCGCCGKPLMHRGTEDHFIPRFMAQGMGNNRWPMHFNCNHRKGPRLPNTRETMRFSQLKGFCDA